MFRSSSIHSLLTGIFRESLSDFRRNQFLSCAVFKVRRAVPASNCYRPSLPSGRPKNGLPSVPVRRRNRSEVSSGFLPRTLKTIQIRKSVRRFCFAFAPLQLYQSVLRRLFRFACRFRLSCECFFGPRQSLIPNSQFRIPNSFRRST